MACRWKDRSPEEGWCWRRVGPLSWAHHLGFCDQLDEVVQQPHRTLLAQWRWSAADVRQLWVHWLHASCLDDSRHVWYDEPIRLSSRLGDWWQHVLEGRYSGDTRLDWAWSVWMSAWAVGGVVGGECSEWFGGRFGGRVIMTLMSGWWSGVINPTRWVGLIRSLGVILPRAPGFPLVRGRLIVGLVVGLGIIIVGRWMLMVLLVFPRCRMKSGWSVTGFISCMIIISIM